MRNLLNSVPANWMATSVRGLLSLPDPLLRLLVGPPVRIDGQRLATSAQLMLRLQRVVRTEFEPDATPEQARARFRQLTVMLNAAAPRQVPSRDISIPGPGQVLAARLYEPEGLTTPSPLMVYFHGGGWVVGDLDSHDGLCHFLAAEGELRVLSVDYRLAPEDTFPAAFEDAHAAFEYAVSNAASLGVDPARIALGGDSAGGNLAAAVAQHTGDGQRPAFLFLIYPSLDATTRRRSRELFGENFFLTDEEINWFREQYAPNPETHPDPRLSPLRAVDVSGLPPTYIVTAGFDPLRDEGEEYAKVLRAAGVPVELRRQRGLFHGFANLIGLDATSREAVREAIGALRLGLAFGVRNKMS